MREDWNWFKDTGLKIIIYYSVSFIMIVGILYFISYFLLTLLK